MKLTKHPRGTALAALLLSALLLGGIPAAAAAAPIPESVAIEAVLDSSGSVEDPKGGGIDPEGLRFQSMDLLLGQFSAEVPLSAGAVLFSTDILCDTGLIPITGPQDRQLLLQTLQAAPSGGWTDLGEGLDAAVDTLCRSDAAHRACVIATDGRILCGGEEDQATLASIQTAKQAADRAKEAGVTVYGLYLNFNGQADPRGLTQLEDLCDYVHEVDSLAGLDAACVAIYNSLITGSELPPPIPVDMPCEEDFFLPDGLDAARITVSSTQIDQVELTLTPLSGSESDVSELPEEGTPSTRVVQLSQPQPGRWRLSLNGPAGSKATVQKIFETSLWAGVRLTDDQAVPQSGQPLDLTLWLENDQRRAIDLTGYAACVQVTDAQGNLLSEVSVPAEAMTGTEVALPVELPQGDCQVQAVFRYETQLTLASQALELHPASSSDARGFPLIPVLLGAVGLLALALLAFCLLRRRSGGAAPGDLLRVDFLEDSSHVLCSQEVNLEGCGGRIPLLDLVQLALVLAESDPDQDGVRIQRAKELAISQRPALKKAVLSFHSGKSGAIKVLLDRQPCPQHIPVAFPAPAPILLLTYIPCDSTSDVDLWGQTAAPEDDFDFQFPL